MRGRAGWRVEYGACGGDLLNSDFPACFALHGFFPAVCEFVVDVVFAVSGHLHVLELFGVLPLEEVGEGDCVARGLQAGVERRVGGGGSLRNGSSRLLKII
jgi:hypothetical protein